MLLLLLLKQFAILLSFLVIFSHGKSVYDQRQDGKLNVHAQLDNIMIVIATPGDKGPSSLFNDIASQILELRGLTSRNKQVSVADEEILEEGKDPLNVKILRIETNADNQESQGQKLSSLLPSENHSKAIEISKIHDIKGHLDQNHHHHHQLHKEEIHHHQNVEKKITSSDNQQILGKLGISGKIHSHKNEKIDSHTNDEKKIHSIEKVKINDDIKIIKNIENTENSENSENTEITKNTETDKDSSLKEKTPEKFISFGTISSVDGKVVYISEKKHSSDSLDEIPSEKDSKKNLEKSAHEEIGHAKIEHKPKGDKSISTKSSSSSSSLLLDEKLENHESVHQNEKKIQNQQNIETIIRKIRRIARGLENSLKDSNYSEKSRMSLKKELPRFDNLDNIDEGDKNEVRLIANQKSQLSLKPIGDMIENCGPGRIRNRYGICQFDESFN
ncbi:histone-lysine N-methyltransferase set1-like [Leptopilina boulardi]|uniref:histone-lysine N-methyltransferase set1-like n=1 Tax=Leptopilina boulardi TaxID=63433 RepID=UPI0021F59735|nr:histone-lysine N-methyltransferase set1-like [Leptopilina boulardi]